MRRFAVLAMLAALCVAAAVPASAAPEPVKAKVVQVVDGDTVKVRVGKAKRTVRLIGVDTPETKAPGRPIECYGPQATRAAKNLMPRGRVVWLTRDPRQPARDRYKRFLYYVARTRSQAPARSVNNQLVLRGAGEVLVVGRKFTHYTAFTRAENTAKRKNRGLWGACDPPPPPPPNGSAGGNCDPNYTGACVPVYPPDVNCSDIGRPVTVVGSDPHWLDGDGDGAACESS